MKRIAAVVTAAGFGRRYGPGGKLHARLDGRPVIAWTLDTLAALPLAARIVVIAPDDTATRALADLAGVTVVVNPAPAAGLGRSIACGVQQLPDATAGVLIMLGDMPLARATTALALMAAFEALDTAAIVAPLHAGQRGHPVLFGADHLPALAALTGDHGARDLLQRVTVNLLPVDDAGVLLDIDTPADLAAAGRSRLP